jgi:hypothetical protein
VPRPEEGGPTMTMGIAVAGEKVVAYTRNGTTDEAYFFGTQKDGHMDLMSMYGDDLEASFDGKMISGEVTMNETGAAPVKFAAAMVAAPAGIYTAEHDNSRASWVVRPDHSITGVMDNSAPGDHKVTDAIMACERRPPRTDPRATMRERRNFLRTLAGPRLSDGGLPN